MEAESPLYRNLVRDALAWDVLLRARSGVVGEGDLVPHLGPPAKE